MPNNDELNDMLNKLFKRVSVVEIPFKQIAGSFRTMGIRYEMGGGKWCELIEKTDTTVLIRGFMPKGTSYPLNMHPDANESLTVITGKLKNVNFGITKESLGNMTWKKETPHDLLAIEDTIFYSLFTKITNENEQS